MVNLSRRRCHFFTFVNIIKLIKAAALSIIPARSQISRQLYINKSHLCPKYKTSLYSLHVKVTA